MPHALPIALKKQKNFTHSSTPTSSSSSLSSSSIIKAPEEIFVEKLDIFLAEFTKILGKQIYDSEKKSSQSYTHRLTMNFLYYTLALPMFLLYYATYCPLYYILHLIDPIIVQFLEGSLTPNGVLKSLKQDRANREE